MRGKTGKEWLWLLALAAGVVLAGGCVQPAQYSDWQWKQYNPEYQPLPGDPQR